MTHEEDADELVDGLETGELVVTGADSEFDALDEAGALDDLVPLDDAGFDPDLDLLSEEAVHVSIVELPCAEDLGPDDDACEMDWVMLALLEYETEDAVALLARVGLPPWP